jgi:hypothetical protein
MDQDLDGKAIRKVTLRLPVDLYLSLDDLARAARKPLAVVIRSMLLNREVKAAPPLIAELSEHAQHFIKISPSLLSNLQQLYNHAERLGGVYLPLISPTGGLKTLADQAKKICLTLKKGEPLSSPLTEQKAKSFADACEQVNNLTYSLNGSNSSEIGASDWKEPLNQLASSLDGL